MARHVLTVAAGSALLSMFLAAAMAQPVAANISAADILATADLGGKAPPAGGVTFKPWWEGDAPAEDVVVAVTFKDTFDAPTLVNSHNGVGGSYGFHFAGLFGGAKDGQTKQALVPVSKAVIARHKDGFVLRLTGAAAAIDRMDVVKATPARWAGALEQCRSARAAHVEAMKKVFKELPPAEEPPLGDVAAEFQQMGFVPYVRSYNVDVFPATVPKPEERGAKAIEAYATPGEFEPLQAAAYALKDLTLTAGVSDLTGPGTLKAGTDVRIHWLEPVAVRSGGGSSIKQWQVKPVWLRDSGPVKLAAKTSAAWYVVVRVPADAKAGDYKGTLTLAAEGGAKAQLPIHFKVLPFTLDKADHIARGMYTPGPMTADYVRDLADHGMNAASTWQGHLPPAMVDGKCVAQPTAAMDAYLRALKAAGFVKMVYFGGGDNRYANPANVPGATNTKVGTPEFEKVYGEYWLDIRRLEKANGWPEMVCCPFDEPVKDNQKVKNYQACYTAVKKVSPETLVFCVFMNRPWAAERLGREADIWSCNGAFDKAQAEKAKLAAEGVGKLFYPYTGCTAGSRAGTVRFNAGVNPWRYDADGIYFWAYLWHAEDPFNDLDGAYTDWTPSVRDIDGRIYNNVGFEGWREGVDDRRYIETCLRMAREKGRKDILEKMDQLKKDLAAGTESETSVRTQGLDDFFFKIDNTSVLDVYRARVVAMILEMLK